MSRFRSVARLATAVSVAVVLLATTVVVGAVPAQAQLPLFINEVMAANDSYTDNYGETPDWIEIENNGPNVNLAGWNLTDSDGNVWPMPSTILSTGGRLLIWASGRNEYIGAYHANFKLSSAGETVTLSEPNGAVVAQMAYPELAADQSYGRDSSGDIGFLLSPTPDGPNSGLAPAQPVLNPAPQVFSGASPLTVTLTANLSAGDTIRYTTNDAAVTASSPTYTGPFTLTNSTIVRAAVVSSSGVIGPEISGGYTALSSSLMGRTSDLPMVLVHARGAVDTTVITDSIVTMIDVDPVTGRSALTDTPDFTGFAGLRARGASSFNFPKNQYKFETWADASGVEEDADLLGLGSESDWVLYAPGVYDRALINNALMYEFAHRIGVSAPDYRFVELWIENNSTGTVGEGDYVGIYLLRETINIDSERVDIDNDSGVILRYDWNDSCCENIKLIENIYPNRTPALEIADPNSSNLSSTLFSSTSAWWNNLESAARSGSFSQASQFIDWDSYIDHWLLEMLAMDVDVLRASHYLHRDQGGKLMGGPMWDYDRSMGAADTRVDQLSEAQAWEPNGNSGHSWNGYIYQDVWQMPEVQALIRSRWQELRQGILSDSAVTALVFELGGQLSESYPRETSIWNGTIDGYTYGARSTGGALNGTFNGELSHMDDWLQTRLAWLDGQFLSGGTPPSVSNPGTLTAQPNQAVSWQIQASDSQPMVWSVSDLPEGLVLDPLTGVISGTVPYGDGGTFPTSVTVTDSSGASTTVNFTINIPSPVVGDPAVVLNEYNAVDPGGLLDLGGSDTYFGQVGGNGGNWFEIVVVEDNLDMRGWRFESWANDNTGTVRRNATLTLGTDDLLSNLRAGTIITVSQSEPDDLSYNPNQDDWTLNFQSNSAGAGSMFSTQEDFDTNNKKWRLVVRDSGGAIRAVPAGETDPWDAANLSGVSGAEVMALEVTPSTSVDPVTDYVDRTNSTFGAPNPGQDLESIRPATFTPGDVDCTDSVSLIDARIIAQYAIGGRTDGGSCPLPSPSTQLLLVAADVDGSGSASLLDARIVAQCSIGASNVLCP